MCLSLSLPYLSYCENIILNHPSKFSQPHPSSSNHNFLRQKMRKLHIPFQTTKFDLQTTFPNDHPHIIGPSNTTKEPRYSIPPPSGPLDSGIPRRSKVVGVSLPKPRSCKEPYKNGGVTDPKQLPHLFIRSFIRGCYI